MNSDLHAVGTPVRIRLTDYGVEPDSGLDALPAMRRALEAASQAGGPVVLECPQGRYDFYPYQASRSKYYITNTASEEENPDVTKTIAILMKDVAQLTLEGNGSLFLMHGRMTLLAIDGCDDIEIRNLHLDYAWPTVAEMKILESGSDYFEALVHPDSRYELQNGRIYWVGDGWRFNEGPMQAFDPARNKTWRIDNLGEQAIRVEELGPNRLRFFFDAGTPLQPAGRVLQVRDGIRDQVGVFIHRSRNVRLIKSGIHFMHGLGIVGQYSEHLRFAELDLSPRSETGRTVTAFADFIHLSGCRGMVEIEDSRFIGSHDDVVNAHGTYLQIVEAPKANQVRLRFMHPQTYGFEAFFPGDAVAFVKSESLQAYGTGTVRTVEAISPRECLLTLEDDLPSGVTAGDAIENVTWTPELHVRRNYFARVSTRGVLASTRRKVVIEDNVFDGMTMSGVFVCDEAENWFESGPVRDLVIRNNRFLACGDADHPVIYIAPENREVDASLPVHSGIVIEDNRIETTDAAALDAKSVRGIRFAKNVIVPAAAGAAAENTESGVEKAAAASIIRLTACSEVTIDGNVFAEEGTPSSVVATSLMAPNELHVEPRQGLRIEE